MAKVERLERVLKELEKLAKDPPNVTATVGYTQEYAIYVHEDLTAHHPVGQAKYLEQPARENADTYAKIVVKGLKKGLGFVQAITLAALRLQRDSQKLVPVDTGALKNSAFTSVEEK